MVHSLQNLASSPPLDDRAQKCLQMTVVGVFTQCRKGEGGGPCSARTVFKGSCRRVAKIFRGHCHLRRRAAASMYNGRRLE